MSHFLNVWRTPRYPSDPYSVHRHETEAKAREEIFDHFDGQGYDGFFYVETIVVDGKLARVVSFEDDALAELLDARERRRQDDGLQAYVRSKQ